MISSSIALWFFVFGGLTSLLALQFVFPRWYSRTFNKVEVEGPGLLYARQGGLAIAIQGLLLIWAGFDPSLRFPAAVLVALGKACFVVTIVVHLKKYPGLLVSAVVDAVAVAVLGTFLLGW